MFDWMIELVEAFPGIKRYVKLIDQFDKDLSEVCITPINISPSDIIR